MNHSFDYKGFAVSKSEPKTVLRTVKKTLSIDSADRDTTKYYTNGDFVVYLPRVYENVVSLRLTGAEFPPLVITSGSPGALTHLYTKGLNVAGTASNWSSDTQVDSAGNNYYFMIDIEGLNKTDETAVSSNKSTFTDSFFAKIPATTTSYGGVSFIEYNDHSNQENIAKFSPGIKKLDRLRIRTRLHSQQDRSGFIYWTGTGAYAGATTNTNTANFSLTLELEMLDNSFDDFSSFETHLRDMKLKS
jgi:hypothetical protein